MNETQQLAYALFRGFLQVVKSIAAIYGWSVKDENGNLLAEQCPHCRGAQLQVGAVRIVKRIKID